MPGCDSGRDHQMCRGFCDDFCACVDFSVMLGVCCSRSSSRGITHGQGLNWREWFPPDLRSATSCLRSTTSNNRSCTSQLRSGTFCWDPPLCTVFILIVFSMRDVFFFKKCSPSRSFCHLHLSMLGVDRSCKHQTLFKCHKSQTECVECTKTPGRRSGTPPLLSALQASRLQGSASSC